MMNKTQKGTVKIVRREDFKSGGAVHVYEWEVRPISGEGLGGQVFNAPHLHGTVTHRYSDGAFVLMRKVLSAYERAVKKAK